MSTRAVGRRWEGEARRHLEASGLKLVERNYNCRMGELDLVFMEGDMLVFVEVRFRRHSGFGSGAESVSLSKRRRLIAAARHFLMSYPRHAEKPCRFDVVSIGSGDPPQVEWIRNAFTLDEA